MSSNPMGPMSNGSDDKWQQCEQDIEDLESRVSALEAKAGISSPADETEPVGGKTFPVKNAMTTGKMPFLGGSYK